MTRKSFGEDDFVHSATLQNVSANLDLVRRLEHLSLAELGKRTGLSDRHLDSLIRMRSNVTVLVLEKIADSLGIPFLTFIGTRLDTGIPGGSSGFLDRLRNEQASLEETTRDPSPFSSRSMSDRRQQIPSGLTPDLAHLLQHLISQQEQLAQSQINLALQVEELSKAINPRATERGSSSTHSARTLARTAGADPSLVSPMQPKAASVKSSASTEVKNMRAKAAPRPKSEPVASQRRKSRKTSS
ncbi:helix-turn-helix domain-containing protein [Microvirga guangxiensis]|uniref:Helix-turn-helix n=1 Tax=Microvirga guangxiensis TaxID=549386 RepID=A0A1G5KF84_9HYPH|nr:helix-turn-helix transcriptional regulator [Microvirga guangxiensis]SCY98748.1 Helix-turn-helix [Microvirga guangxiensis]